MPAITLAGLLAASPAAQAPERIVGLLTLPEVFGNAPGDKFNPQDLRVAARPPGRRDDTSVRVLGSRRANDTLWIEVEIFSHSHCVAPDEPRVIDRGWVPAHAASGEPAVWFYSRGC